MKLFGIDVLRSALAITPTSMLIVPASKRQSHKECGVVGCADRDIEDTLGRTSVTC
jgi:hypothetical protein